MALPNIIANGQTPDGNKIQENFDYLADGAGLKIDTLVNLRTFATLNPTVVFLCFATDVAEGTLMIYAGDITKGDKGFLTIASAGGEAIDTSEVGT